MKWTFENIETNLDDLNPRIRNKALEIANRLMEEGGYTEEEAIDEGIKEAEEWFLDTQG